MDKNKGKAKELKTSPFKIKNKLEKEQALIQKIIDKVKKNTVESEQGQKMQAEVENLLKSTKNPIQAWIRGNAFDILGYSELAVMFKNKAAELGYVVEGVNEGAKAQTGLYVKGSTASDTAKIQSLIDDPEWAFTGEYNADGNYFLFDELPENYDELEKHMDEEFLKHGISASFEGIFSNENEQHQSELNTPAEITKAEAEKLFNDGIYVYVQTKTDEQLDSNHNAFSMNKDYFDASMNIYSAGKTPLEYGFDNIINFLLERTELDNGKQREFKYFTLYSKTPWIIENGGKIEEGKKEECQCDGDCKCDIKNEKLSIGSKARISQGSGLSSGEIVTIVDRSKVKTDGRGVPTNVSGAYKPVDWSREFAIEFSNGEIGTMFKNRLEEINEGVAGGKQQFEYSPNEETKWNLFGDKNVKAEKPKYNNVALKHMISDDAFLKFSYHNLSTGNEEKDLDMIFNTYIKGDKDMERKLHSYDNYTYKMMENANARDFTAQQIMGSLQENGFEVGDLHAVASDLSKWINEKIEDAKHTLSLYTPDVRNELKKCFGEGNNLAGFVSALRASDLTIEDIKLASEPMPGDKPVSAAMPDKIAKAFGISKDAAYFVSSLMLTAADSMISKYMYTGAETVTHLLGAVSGILLMRTLDIQ